MEVCAKCNSKGYSINAVALCSECGLMCEVHKQKHAKSCNHQTKLIYETHYRKSNEDLQTLQKGLQIYRDWVLVIKDFETLTKDLIKYNMNELYNACTKFLSTKEMEEFDGIMEKILMVAKVATEVGSHGKVIYTQIHNLSTKGTDDQALAILKALGELNKYFTELQRKANEVDFGRLKTIASKLNSYASECENKSVYCRIIGCGGMLGLLISIGALLVVGPVGYAIGGCVVGGVVAFGGFVGEHNSNEAMIQNEKQAEFCNQINNQYNQLSKIIGSLDALTFKNNDFTNVRKEVISLVANAELVSNQYECLMKAGEELYSSLCK